MSIIPQHYITLYMHSVCGVLCVLASVERKEMRTAVKEQIAYD